MIRKNMILPIKGKNVVLNFDANFFYEFYKEDSGHDLIANPVFDPETLGSTEIFKLVQSIIWAGYQSECAVKEQATELTKDNIRHFVMSKNETSAMDVLYELISCLSGKTVEEIKNVETQAVKP